MIRTALTEVTIQGLHLRPGERFRILGEREVYTFQSYVEHGAWRWIECHSHDYGYRALYVGDGPIYHAGLGTTIKPYQITSPFTRTTKRIAKRAIALQGKHSGSRPEAGNGQAGSRSGEHHHQYEENPMSETTTQAIPETKPQATKASKKAAKPATTAVHGPLSPKAPTGRKAKAKAAAAAKAQPKATRSPKAQTGGDRKPGILTLAAEILAKRGEPMNCQAMVEEALKRGWTTNGKTPAATLYAAIIREIATKGKEARFNKADRGMFEASKAK